jgi:hypothetical protein
VATLIERPITFLGVNPCEKCGGSGLVVRHPRDRFLLVVCADCTVARYAAVISANHIHGTDSAYGHTAPPEILDPLLEALEARAREVLPTAWDHLMRDDD